MINGAVKQIKLATDDEEKRFEALAQVSEFLASNFSEDRISTSVGSERNELIKELTSNPDPYAELKKEANQTALDLKPFAEEFVDNGSGKEERLKNALRVSTVANSMEFGVSGYDFDPDNFKSEFEELFESELEIDDSEKIVSKILSSDEIIFLTDNCGEIILDQILMNEIQNSGVDLLIGAKSKPVQEDVTLETAKKLGIEEFGEVFPAVERWEYSWMIFLQNYRRK